MPTATELAAVDTRRGDWMQTYTGRQFWPLDPRAEEIDIADIAHALSLICRYGGHAIQFYSVAEHCVLMSQAVSEPSKKWALLHDAAEAYLGDIIRPLKRHLDGYSALEMNLMREVCHRFNLMGLTPDEVEQADNRILLDERAQNMAPTPHDWHVDGPPLGVTLRFWTPRQAEFAFIKAFNGLR